ALQSSALRECRIGRLWKIDEPLLEIVRILSDASPECDFQIHEPAFEPIRLGFGGSRHFRGDRRCGSWSLGEGHRLETIFRQSLIEAVHLFADERFVKGNLRIQELETNLSGRGFQFEWRAAAIQNGNSMYRTRTIGRCLHRQ